MSRVTEVQVFSLTQKRTIWETVKLSLIKIQFQISTNTVKDVSR